MNRQPSVLNLYNMLPAKFAVKKKQYKNYDQIRLSIPMRCAIIGAAGSGKTNVLINLLLGMNCFTFFHFYVRCPEEPLYAWLFSELDKVSEKLGKTIYTVEQTLDNLLPIDEYDPAETNVVIFDDQICEEKKALKDEVGPLWMRGRKLGAMPGISTIFLSQAYYQIPKLIRQNTDVVIFKSLQKRDLNLVLSEFAVEKSKEELLEMYRKCRTNEITSFFMIDNSSGQDPRFKYRCCFEPIE